MRKAPEKEKQRILFGYKTKNIFSFEKGGPNEFLYGLNFIQKKVSASPIFAHHYQPCHSPYKLLEKIIASRSKLGIYFQLFLNNKDKIRKNDLLFGINDGAGLGLLFFKLINRINNRVVVLIQGLHDRVRFFENDSLLMTFYQKLLNKADLILTLSSYEQKLLIKKFNLKPEKTKMLFFGPDIKYWAKKKMQGGKEKKEFVLTLGNDMHRDYDLLLKHYHLKIPLKFVTRILTGKQLKIIKNNPLLNHCQQVSNKQLKALYQKAKFIVIPLKNTWATSGLSATLQALSMEKPVLLTRAPALQELFTDRKHLLYYQENSPASFKQGLNELNNNQGLRRKLAKNGRKLVEEKFNSRLMAHHLLRLFNDLF